MVNKILVFLMAISTSSSCALASFEIEYFEFFQEAYKRKCPVIPINAYFSKLGDEIAGYCIPGFGILLNEDKWPEYGPYQRRELVFHELGHCVLQLNHSEPGLMSPKMHKEDEVRQNWKPWLEQLFASCRNKL